jgi:hypothetical protein
MFIAWCTEAVRRQSLESPCPMHHRTDGVRVCHLRTASLHSNVRALRREFSHTGCGGNPAAPERPAGAKRAD